MRTRDRLSKQYRPRPGDAEHIPFLEFTHIPSYPFPLQFCVNVISSRLVPPHAAQGHTMLALSTQCLTSLWH